MSLVLLGIGLLLVLVIYLRVASHLSLFDTPNHRSSHTKATITGGGLVIPLGVLVWAVTFGYSTSLFLIALLLISVVSFLDDLWHLPAFLRFLVHMVAVGLVSWNIYDLFFDSQPYFHIWLILASLLYLTWINASNFMDGINGMMVAHGMVSLATFWYLSDQFSLSDPNLIIVGLVGVAVLAIFNFRTKALCFAGDIGSISLAFLLGYLMLQLILTTQDWTYLLFFIVYGIDSAGTIIERLIKRQNILAAHRMHLYQLFVNTKKVPHLVVSTAYAVLQLAISFGLIALQQSQFNSLSIIYCALVLVILLTSYLILKIKMFRVLE